MSYIKKKDFIALYGEEAWVAYTAKKNEYNRQWKEEHPDYNKQYRAEHNEELKEYGRQWREEHPDYSKQWREEHPDYDKQYHSTQLGRAKNLKNKYIYNDKEKGFSTDQNIDEDWIIEHIFNSSCIYCGDSDWKKLGADRIDNTKGHTPDNCVCACWDCNNKRKSRFTVEEFQLIKQNILAP